MAPVRSRPRPSSDPSASNPSTSRAKPSHPSKKSHHARPEPVGAAVPGVQKLKAALRQTRRLLAKDGLAADVRVATERRLAAQEAELAGAELARTERAMAVRYHKIKFFERQKVARKIVQTKRALGALDVKKSARKTLERTLLDLRVDLNYIIHYPKTEKYIALFPPAARGGGGGGGAVAAAPTDAAEQAKTDARRAELRTWVRSRMDDGAFGAEPEAALERAGARGDAGRDQAAPVKKKVGAAAAPAQGGRGAAQAEDDFFEAASGGEESEGGESEVGVEESESDT